MFEKNPLLSSMGAMLSALLVATAYAASNNKDAELGCDSEEVEVCTGHEAPSAEGAYGEADCEGFSFTLSNVVNAVERSKRVRRWSGDGECQEDEDLGTTSEEIVPNVSWSATLADGETSSGEGASAFVARGNNMSASCTFTLSAEMPLCGKTLEVSYGAVAVLDFALSVACEPDIVGQDRTGDPESEYEGPCVVAEANIEPDLPCVEGVEWSCTCDEGRSVETDWSYALAITNREAASETWMDNEAKASAKGKSAAAQFTILKLDVEIGGQGEKDEHETGAFLKHVQDANDDGLMNQEGTNAMVSVKFTCWPEVVPDDVELEVENSGPGELYEKLPDDTLVLVTKTNYPASGISEREFWLHGHEKSGSLKDGSITIQIEDIEAIDEAYYTSVVVDLDVDSDNSGEIEGADMCAEDLSEDKSGLPGKALYLNELDVDKDSIPDWADGFDSGCGAGTQSSANASGKFAQMRLAAFAPTELACVKFVCPEADWGAVVSTTGNGSSESPLEYAVAAKKVRIWTKDGTVARSKAAYPKGDLIKTDVLYPLAKLLGDCGGNLYVEAIGGSESIGDVRVSAVLYPQGEDGEQFEDAVRMTVFYIDRVCPVEADFASGNAGKVMISTRQDQDGPGRYYTETATTIGGKPAQSQDAQVVATAYLKPVPAEPIPGLAVNFEVIDPDDLSHYEGKSEAGTPGIQGDVNPNDNCDHGKCMSWNDGQPAGYDAYQGSLSSRKMTPKLNVVNGNVEYMAETTLGITTRYAGDNYRVRATLADPDGKPFDTVSGMTAGVPFVRSPVKQSATLIAWKRVYIEQDEMYKAGCTVTSAFTPDPEAETQAVSVDCTDDFKIGDSATAIWKDGSASGLTVVGKMEGKLLVRGLSVPVPKFGGFKIDGQEETYTVDRRFLPNAYGSAPDGSDGGAFIEFRLLDSLRNPNSRVPKYAIIPTSSTQNSYVDYWFDNKEMIHQNVFCLTIANERFDGSLGATRGSWVVVYCSSHSGLDVDGVVCDEIVQIEETVAHEIGHRMGVVKKVGTAYSYVDELIDKGCHDDTDMCVMSYKNRNNGVAEFSIDALLGGSNGDRIDSLRGFPGR